MLRTRSRSTSLIWSPVAFCLLLAGTIWGQQSAGSLRGTVADQSGAVIAGATVKIMQGEKLVQQTQSDGLGAFSVPGLSAGEYTVRVVADGFGKFESDLQQVTAGRVVQVAVTLNVLAVTQQVTVTSDQAGGVSLESAANANAIVLQGADLEALPDDPDELKADLQALAGPATGSNGAQTYVDGFSSSHLPPKNAIREVRVNQDPFSAQYDHVGLGRVEVLTKPGTGQMHGTAQFKMSDALFNSRNPYAPMKPPYRAEQFAGDVGGPLSRRASFFLEFEGRWANDNAVVNAVLLDSALNISPFTHAVVMPQNELTASGRIDYKLSEKHSLTGRYEWNQVKTENAGVGGFVLPSGGYSLHDEIRTVQLTENAVLSNTAINETRFQFIQNNLQQQATSSAPVLKVMDAFTSGGSLTGNLQRAEGILELQNYTTKTLGRHSLTFGGQIYRDHLDESAPANFSGTFVFSGGVAPELNALNQIVLGPTGNPVLIPLSSIERYQRNQVLQRAGFSSTNIAALGGGGAQFSVATGQPAAALTQTSIGLFVQDSWRVTPTLSINGGLRWEGQNDIYDWKDFAPRFGLAWMPGGKHSKTVVRLGTGVFYDHFPAQQVLQTERFNGQRQQQFIVENPRFYPQVPSIASLQAMGLPQTIRTLSPNLRSSYLLQTSLGVEREMPLGMLISLTYINSQGRHLLVSQNVTAPNLAAANAASSISAKTINYQYRSAGVLDENQFIAGVRRPFHNGFMVYARYEYNRAFSNTDGVNTFPANQFNLQADYGRALSDIRHNFVLGASLTGPLGTCLNPFVVVRSGAPFNITSGHDNNGDTLFTDRPAFDNANQPGAVITPFGVFNLHPSPGATIIPHNYGEGPGFTILNFRLSRSFGIGPAEDGQTGPARTGPALSSLFSSPTTKHRYNLTVGVIVRNVLNTNNPGLPIGNLSSRFFGRSNWLASASGPADVAFGNNRRVQFQLRFDF